MIIHQHLKRLKGFNIFLNSVFCFFFLFFVFSINEFLGRGFRFTEDWNSQPSMAIDGDTLEKIFEDPELIPEFLSLTSLMRCVLCCRVSPMQKATVVKIVK